MTSSIDIVIVNFNTRERTTECIASVLDQKIPGVQVIVVDNGSADGSAESFRTRFAEVTVIEAGENLGFARGVNLGAAAGVGDFVLLLNPDASVFPGSIEALRDFALAHPDHGLYGGRTLRPDGSLDPSSCWGAPTLWSLAMFATTLSTVFKRSTVFDPESLGRWERDTVREVPVITGCLLLTRRSLWQSMGGMDERFFLYGEDAEFSHRARRQGLRPIIVPDAVIEHDVGGSTASSGRKMAMVMAGKATYLRAAWNPLAAGLGIALLQAGAGTRAILERVTRAAKRTWRDVWASRSDWRDGYPRAERTLFGRTPPALIDTADAAAGRAAQPLVIEAEPAFRTAHANPYNADLARALQRRGHTVRDLSYARLLFRHVDVVHLHWPDLTFLSGTRRVIHLARVTFFYSFLAVARLRGTTLVWTVHNVDAHEERSIPWLRGLAWRRLTRNLDGIIALTSGGLQAARERHPELAAVPGVVTRHGHYRRAYDLTLSRAEARDALGIDAEEAVVLSLGQIRAYKNVPHLVRIFRDVDRDARLVVAGHAPAALAAEVNAAAEGDPRVDLRLGFVPEAEIAAYLRAADLVVLPYRKVQNSGSAILALSADRRVLVPDLGAMSELQDDVGEGWARLYTDELTGETLADAIDWAREPAAGSVDLTLFDWDVIAQETERAYLAFGRRGPGNTSSRRATVTGEPAAALHGSGVN